MINRVKKAEKYLLVSKVYLLNVNNYSISVFPPSSRAY